MSNNNKSEIEPEEAQKCAINYEDYSQVKCSEGELCYMMCSAENCHLSAIFCEKIECKCRQKHKEYHREIKKRTMETIDPKEICKEIKEKNLASFKYLEAWLDEEIEDFIKWAREFKGHICERIAGLAPNEQQRKFLQLGYTKGKIDELTGNEVFGMLKSLEESDLNSDERFIKKTEKDIKNKWGEIIAPVKNLMESLEEVLNKLVSNSNNLKNKEKKKKTKKIEESSEESEWEEFDENIILAENENIQGDLKDYLEKKNIKNPTEMYLEGNELEQVTIKSASLEKLDLTSNRIKSVHLNLVQLKVLILKNNIIRDIKELAKARLSCLEGLNIERNQITVLPELTGMPRLKEAWFGSNLLENMDGFSNSKLNNLSILFLESNKIRSIEWFVRLLPNVKQLKMLFLYDNIIEQLPNMSVLENHHVKLSFLFGKANVIKSGLHESFKILEMVEFSDIISGRVLKNLMESKKTLHETPKTTNICGRGCPISNYSEFLKTTSAALKMIKCMTLTLTAKNKEEFEQKKEEFKLIDEAMDIKWFKDENEDNDENDDEEEMEEDE